MRLFRYFTIALYKIIISTCKKDIDDLGSKILGGVTTKIELFPYAVKFFNANAFCSGSIINSWCVLTAAHCFDKNKDIHDMAIGVGSNYLQDYAAHLYDVIHFVTHPEYNRIMLFASDIALIFVEQPFKFSQTVQKALLDDNLKWMDNKENIVVIGWGWTKADGPMSEEGLMKTELKYLSKQECEMEHQMNFTKEMFCLYGDGVRDTCYGDSGGGVSWHGKVIGIVSHGYKCAIKEKPSLYISVWYYRKWIEETIEEFVTFYCKRYHN